MKIERVWAMPNGETFSIPPVGELLQRWLSGAKTVIDPFARNAKVGTWTNDLNPHTTADYHMDVLDFLKMLCQKNVVADAAVFDPPYSPRQIKELYNGIGLPMGPREALRTSQWREERDLIHQLVRIGGIYISFGWNSAGMGKGRGWRLEEILLVCHGSGHNDTIVVVERKMQTRLEDAAAPAKEE